MSMAMGNGAPRASMDDPQLSLEAALAFVDAYSDETEQLQAAAAATPTSFTAMMQGFDMPPTTLYDAFDTSAGFSALPAMAPTASSVAAAPMQTAQRQPQDLEQPLAVSNSSMMMPTPTTTTPGSDDGKKPSKKRVRRQKEELVYLRTKVKEMEGRLSQLKRINTGANTAAGSSDSSSSTAMVSKPQGKSHPSALLASVWERLAQRQFQERERAEQENATLKATLEGQIKIAKTLEKLLKSRSDADDAAASPTEDTAYLAANSGEEPIETTEGSATANSSDEDQTEDVDTIYDQMREGVEKAYHEVDAVFAATGLANAEPSFDIQLKTDVMDGMFVQLAAVALIPFSREVTSSGVWRFMRTVAMQAKAYYYKESPRCTDDLTMREFGVKIDHEGQTLDLRGKHVAVKFEETDRLVVVWQTIMEPVRFANGPTKGIGFRDQGYMIVRPGEISESAVLQTCVQVTPNTKDGDQAAVGVLSDLLIGCVDSNMHVGQQMLDAVLMEEECKTTMQGIQ